MRSQVGTRWKQVVNSLVIWPRIWPKDLEWLCLQCCSFNYSCKKVLKERSPDNKATSNCLLDLVPLVALSSTSFTFQLLPLFFVWPSPFGGMGDVKNEKKKCRLASSNFDANFFNGSSDGIETIVPHRLRPVPGMERAKIRNK
jgi:hypothetical protein